MAKKRKLSRRIEKGDKVKVTEKEVAWIKGSWNGVVLGSDRSGKSLTVRPVGKISFKRWRVAPQIDYLKNGLFLTGEDHVKLIKKSSGQVPKATSKEIKIWTKDLAKARKLLSKRRIKKYSKRTNPTKTNWTAEARRYCAHHRIKPTKGTIRELARKFKEAGWTMPKKFEK